ncbi:MAG: hypothetical protein HWN68_12725 [Desulfobacterales bacterium]|nr:hypothetical protein [Desulfobacterales bacterium]
MKKKQFPHGLETLVEFMVERLKIPTKKEIEGLVKKTERSLLALKLPSRTEFDRLSDRVAALEKAVKGRETAKKTAGSAKPSEVAAAKKKRASTVKSQATDSDKVLQIVKKYRAGTDVGTIKARTGFEDKKIRNILFKLGKKDEIERAGRGVYKAKV